MIKTKIIGLIKKAVKRDVEIEVFAPENGKFGHYSTNVALKLGMRKSEQSSMRKAHANKKNPMEVAENLKSSILNLKSDFLEKIEVALPGFINFWLKPEIFQNEIKEILRKKEGYGRKSKVKSQKSKVQVEFISANPTGSLTIGNGRGGFFGDVLANVLKFAGHKVVREYYINDAKASTQIKELGKTALGEGETYKTKDLEFRIKNLEAKLKRIKDYGEAGYLLAQEVQKDNKKFIEKVLKIKFDRWFSEQSLYQKSAIGKLLQDLEKKKLTYKKDGALWLKTKNFGDNEDRVLIRKTGEPTYFLPDLVYHLDKFKTRKFAQVIDIWGADHHGYEPRLRAGLKALGIFKDNDEKFKVIITQLARLIKKGKEVKMSKRKGEYATLEDLIKEVGLDAARFFFLMNSPDTHMNFDLDLAKERSLKNPVYYVQYAFVRAQSILTKANSKSEILNPKQVQNPKSKILNPLNTREDIDLMRILARFPEIVEGAAKNYNPQVLARYSLDLAREFHNFYEKERIIGEQKDLMLARLALIQATLVIFKNIFNLLEIGLPRKM